MTILNSIRSLSPTMALAILTLYAAFSPVATGQALPSTEPGKTQETKRGVQQSTPKRLDWSFIHDTRFYAGVGFSAGVTAYDISTSHGRERSGLYRNDQGRLSSGRYWTFTAVSNAALLPLDLSPNRKLRWVSMSIRFGLGAWRLKTALGNK